jgi:uncharacterized protein (DUF2141 family)
LRDLLGNRTQAPIEFLFSTGPPISPSRVEGVVYDRITLNRVRGARLLFLPPDSVPYTALTDTAGAFLLPSLPPDAYDVFAFDDRNRNRRLDREFESYDSATVILADTESIGRATLWLVEPDSTPPALVDAVVIDSVRVRLQFDDVIEPDAFPGDARVVIADTLSGRTWPVKAMYVGAPPAPDSLAVAADSLAVAADSLAVAADSLAVAADSLAVAADSLAVAADSLAVAADSVRVPQGQELERLVPSTAVLVDLTEPLTAGTMRITASGFVNLRQLVGGGEAELEYVPPEPEPEPDPEPGLVPEEDAPLDGAAPEGSPANGPGADDEEEPRP